VTLRPVSLGRLGAHVAASAVLLLSFLSAPVPVAAAPAPDSLRVTRTGSSIRLTWQAGTGPYGVYRSPDANDVVRPAWLVGGGVELIYEEPIAASSYALTFYNVDVPLPCTVPSDCDNHRACDGLETCSVIDRRCYSGAVLVCNDGNSCTTDRCDEATQDCVFTELPCDDGNPCTLESCRADVGCYATVDPSAGIGTPADLAGRSLDAYPFFDYVDAFHKGSTVEAAVDTSVVPALAGETCDAYVLAKRSALEWCASAVLQDVRGAPDVLTFTAGSVTANTFPLAGSAGLSAEAGTAPAAGYDLALDCNRNGVLDAGELADGLEDAAGFNVIRDLTVAGPLGVAQFDDIGPEPEHCSGSGKDDMRIYHPTTLDDPLFTGKYPLVVISHGNGHCYDWYDFLGLHLASYGFIVMSHDNDTQPGIETASTTTLQFTDKILVNQGTLGGGVLNGHIDSTRIGWIGHSRGGEGVARACDRLVDEGYTPQRYGAKDIAVISSIAPTDFLGPAQADPHSAPYHLLYGSADGDVCGCPNNSVAQSFGLYERATGPRQSTYVHGADHNDFNCCGFDDFAGPSGTAIGRPEAQQVQKAVQLALLKLYTERGFAAKEILWRQWETFRPLGVGADTVVVNELREAPGRRSFVIDDYQAEPATTTSSSGGAVSSSVTALDEQREREVDGAFDWTGTEPMNGMTRGRDLDLGRGGVFEYASSGDVYYELAVVAGQRDFSNDGFLSFRAAQMTRHPRTVEVLADLTFTVTLVDGSGARSSINIGAYGGGIEEPYQRTGYGAGAGWQNEFETIRIRIADFLRNGSGLDLTNVHAVRFEFGSSFGSDQGRVALDDVELVKE
jgi:hypothetical protein